jgi:hypothetical protein
VTGSGAAALWRAEARLRYDRRRGIAELERCFAAGSAPVGLEGALDGRLVTATLGRGLDVVVEGATRLWLPWSGKTFAAGSGRNRFPPSARPFLRLLWPGYRDHRPGDARGFTAFAFETSVGPSSLDPTTTVLRLDYSSTGSPWPVRLVLDELVAVGDGQHLGQALVRWGGRLRRAAWFALEAPSRGSRPGGLGSMPY